MVRTRHSDTRFVMVMWALGACVCLLMSGCKQQPIELHRLVPREVGGWEAAGEGVIYDRDTLFDYIDGGAELYLAYGFRQALAFRYERDGHPAIVADLFDMGSSEDAFGVFTAERQDPEAGIGQGSEYAAGLLRFWQGRFFVSVWAEEHTAETADAVRALGASIAGAIEPPGPRPQLLDLLPGENLNEAGIRYCHDHLSLNLYYFLAEDNILGLGAQTEVVLAPYETNEATMRLLLVRYPEAEAAARGLDGFLRAYLPEAHESGIAQVESGGWVAAQSLGDVVMVAFDAPSRERAEELLRAVREKTEEQQP